MLTVEFVASRKDGPTDHNTLDSCKLIATFTDRGERTSTTFEPGSPRSSWSPSKPSTAAPPPATPTLRTPATTASPGTAGYREPDRRPDRRDDRPPAREERDRRDDRRPARDEDRPRILGLSPKTGRSFGPGAGTSVKPECRRGWVRRGTFPSGRRWDDRNAQDAYHELKTKHGRTASPRRTAPPRTGGGGVGDDAGDRAGDRGPARPAGRAGRRPRALPGVEVRHPLVARSARGRRPGPPPA